MVDCVVCEEKEHRLFLGGWPLCWDCADKYTSKEVKEIVTKRNT